MHRTPAIGRSSRGRLPAVAPGGRAVLIGLLVLAVPLLGMTSTPSASPAAEGPGRVLPPPPASPVPLPSGPLHPAPSIDPLDQPSGRGEVVPTPEDLVGSWYAGTVGSIGYWNPDSGDYGSGSSQSMAWTFLPDGHWQFGFLMTSALYSCQMHVLVFREGVVAEVDEPAAMVVLDTRLAQMHSEDDCVEANNYERDLPPDDEVLIWRRTVDVYGDALLLRNPTTDYTVFRPT